MHALFGHRAPASIPFIEFTNKFPYKNEWVISENVPINISETSFSSQSSALVLTQHKNNHETKRRKHKIMQHNQSVALVNSTDWEHSTEICDETQGRHSLV